MTNILEVLVKSSYASYTEAYDDLFNQDCIHLGWLNSGIQIPDYFIFQKAYSNRSGSSCLYVDPIYRVMYSVDMGD
jgi:hypothetical protein